jgi:hypothetical protein
MGRGDNRRTLKMRQRKAQAAKKARLARKIDEGKSGKKDGGARAATATDASTTIRRPTEG